MIRFHRGALALRFFVSNPLLTFESTFDLVAQKQNDEQIAMTIGPHVHSQCSTGKRPSLCVFLSRIKPTQRGGGKSSQSCN
jgi:hypothetical protein